jgi:hypothetical protein
VLLLLPLPRVPVVGVPVGLLPPLLEQLRNDLEPLRQLTAEALRRFLLGWLQHLRQRGALPIPEMLAPKGGLSEYITSGGSKTYPFWLVRHLPNLGPSSNKPIFLTSSRGKGSFEQLTSKFASPGYRIAYGGVERAVVVDERSVRFELKERSNDTIFTIGGLPVFSRKWGVGADGKPRRFDEIVTEHPITSGPYTIGAVDSGKRIEFKRIDWQGLRERVTALGGTVHVLSPVGGPTT